MNILFCSLVIFIHILSQAVSTLDPFSWQRTVVAVPQWLSFVAVYGFFLLSGVKLFLSPSMSNPAPMDWKKYYLKRIKRILLPYLIAVVVYYLYFLGQGIYTFSGTQLIHFALTGRIASHFYFIVTLIQFIVLAPLWRRWVIRYSPVIILPLSVGLMFVFGYGINGVLDIIAPGITFPFQDRFFLHYLFFYVAGCYIGANYADFMELVNQHKKLIFRCVGVFTVLDIVCSGWFFLHGNYYVSSHEEQLHMLYMISLILLLFLVLPQNRALPNLFYQLDQVSYLVYLYHMLGILVFNQINHFTTDTVLATICRGLFVLSTVVPLCMLWRLFATHKKQHLELIGVLVRRYCK